MRGILFGAIVTALLSAAGVVSAQTATPTPVNSNVAVMSYAQSRGQDVQGSACTARGGTGCGGCYAAPVPPADPIGGLLGLLDTVNPEWQAIGPMIPGGDASLPPVASPVSITGTVALSKSPGDDFPGSHISPDYNIELLPDDNGRLATGDTDQRLEFEWEGDKYPLFAWAGEGDRVIALGRWIFDCGHPDPAPQGRCSNNASKVCNVDEDCTPGTCSAPAANFNFQAELHPPQAVAMIRNKSIGKTPATRADVYISADAGGASDRCTNTHLASATDVLLSKACFLNHCSVTTGRSCTSDSDCAKKETCIRLDPAEQLADINANDFEFDLPLPPQPAGATAVKIKIKKAKVPKGTVMPKPTVVPNLTDPTPSVHVIVPMSVPIKGQMPNLFAQSISAAWKGDKTKLTHVQVKFTGITINNPVKDATPAIPRVCTDPVAGGLTTATCVDNTSCQAGTCAATGKSCHGNADCKPTDFCTGAAQCVGGIPPGWRVWGEVNGDWVEFTGLSMLGTEAPFAAPPYVQPSTPFTLKQKFKFDEYVPADGSIHIKVSGRSLNCENVELFGQNLKDNLQKFGLTAGAACLLAVSKDPGTVDVTHNGTGFATTTGSATTCTTAGKSITCSATSEGGDAGTCSSSANQLCVTSADCPAGETCNATGGAFTLQYTLQAK